MRLMKSFILEHILNCLTNNCKPPQSFDFLETKVSFRFVWFGKFPWIFCSWWEDGTYPLFYLVTKPISNMISSTRTFKKHQNASTRTYRKNQILLRRFLKEYTYLLSSRGGMKFQKNWIVADFLAGTGFLHFYFLFVSSHSYSHCF